MKGINLSNILKAVLTVIITTTLIVPSTLIATESKNADICLYDHGKNISNAQSRSGDNEALLVIVGDRDEFNNPTNFYNKIMPLVEWRHACGIKTTVVNLTMIIDEIPGPSLDYQKIREYIWTNFDEIFGTWNQDTSPLTSYLLLVGDANHISPCYFNNHPTDHGLTPVASDYWFGAALEPDEAPADWSDFSKLLPDLQVSRISVDNANQLETVVNKILDYSKDPIRDAQHDDWFNTILFAAYNQYYYVSTSDFISDLMDDPGPIGPGKDCIEVYGGLGGTTQQVLDAIDDGAFIVNYEGHGTSKNHPGYTYTGWENPHFTTDHIDGTTSSLNNGKMYPVMFDMSCEGGWFDNEIDHNTNLDYESLAEVAIREPNGGIVADIAATRVNWICYHDELDKGFYDAMYPDFDSNYPVTGTHDNPYPEDTAFFKLGEILNYGKYWMLDKFVNTGGAGYPYGPSIERTVAMMEMMCAFGDPTMEIWTEKPNTMTLTHPDFLHVNWGFFNVVVEDEYGMWVDDAIVCLWKDDEIYLTEKTFNGQADFFIPFTPTVGDMKITVTKHNYIPVQNIIPITEGVPVYDWNFAPVQAVSGQDVYIEIEAKDYDGSLVDYDITFDGTPQVLDKNGDVYSKTINIPPDTIGSVEYNCYFKDNDNNDVTTDTITMDVQSIINTRTGVFYTTIQDAIDDASDTLVDTIEVSPGEYWEKITIDKALILKGLDKDNTFIYGPSDSSQPYVVHITSDGVTLTGFTIQQRAGDVPHDACVQIDSSNNIIEGNIIMDSNFITNTGVEVYISSLTHDNLISGNIIKNSEDEAISLIGSSDNTLISNTIDRKAIGSSPDIGIYLSGSNNNRILMNGFGAIHNGNNDAICIQVYNSDSNCIAKNSFSISSDKGIFFTSNSNDNIVYHNIFRTRIDDAIDQGSNNWDNGYSVPFDPHIDGGNYWRDYDEPSEGAIDEYSGINQDDGPGNPDGIADTPYTGSAVTDNYPLMNSVYESSDVGCWKFNEDGGSTIFDSSPFGNDGIISGDPQWVEGLSDSTALDFNGDDYIEVPDDNSLDVPNEVTVEAWICSRNPSSGLWQLILSKSDYNGAYQSNYEMYIAPSGIIKCTWGDHGSDGRLYSGAIPENQWTFVAFTISEDSASLYIDGSLHTSKDEIEPLITGNQPLFIGSNGVNHWFDGILDNIRIYNRALSESEIYDHYICETFSTPPLADIGGPYNGIALEDILFDGSGSIDTDDEGCCIIEYIWDFGDESEIIYGVNPSHKYNVPGTYTVTLTVIDDEDQIDTDEINVEVSPSTQIDPTADAGGPYAPVFVGEWMNFDGSGSHDNDEGGASIVGYLWNFGDGTTSTQQNPSHRFDDSGYYTVMLTVTDDEGRTDSDEVEVYIENALPTAIITYYYDIWHDNQLVFLGFDSHDNDEDGDSIVEYRWKFFDGPWISTGNDYHITYPEDMPAPSPVITVTLRVIDDEGSFDTVVFSMPLEPDTPSK